MSQTGTATRPYKGMAACWWRTLFPSLGLFLLTAAFIITKTGRDALYFQGGGLADLPKAYLGIAFLSAPVAMGMLRLIRAAGPRHARALGLAGMAVAQWAFSYYARPGGGIVMTLFFMLIPLLYGVLLSITWLLGADLLDRAPPWVLARLYATIGAASMSGGLCGALASRRLAQHFEPESFLVAGAVLLLATAVVSLLADRAFAVDMSAVNHGAVPPPDEGGFAGPRAGELLRIRYVMVLCAVAVAASVVGVLVEYQFYSAASAGASLTLFSNFYLLLNGAALAVQLVATPLLQRVFGVQGSLLILPAVLVGATSLTMAVTGLSMRIGLRVAEGSIKSSVHRSNWEQSYLPLPREARAQAKLLVDGMAARAGEGMAAVLLLLVPVAEAAPGSGLGWIGWVLAAGSVLWLALTAGLRWSMRHEGLLLSEEEMRYDLPIPDG